MTPPNRTCFKKIAPLAAVLLALSLAGCAVPSAILYKTMGPPPIPARYTPPKEPLLVLVENVHSGANAIPEADDLARVVYDDLKEHEVGPLIDPAKIHELRDENPKSFGKMSISDVGRALGAKQILYVHVSELNIEVPPGSEMVRVKVGASVKMVDVATAQTVWPDDGQSEPYQYESRLERVGDNTSRTNLSKQVLHQSGVQIGRWFYNFKPETMTEENADLHLR